MNFFKILRLSVVLLFGLFGGACNESGGDGGGGSEPQTVLVIGDSITGKEVYPGVPLWPSLMNQMQPEWTVINRGTAGEQISGGSDKVRGLLDRFQPDTLVSLYGSNNAIQGKIDGFESELRFIIQSGIAAGARVVVCTVPPMVGTRSIYNGRVDVLNSIIRSVASAEGAKVVDLAREFKGAGTEVFPDGLHPNLDGQRIIAIAVSEKI